MKKTTIIMLVAAALALLILPANAAITENISYPVSFSFFVPCVNGGAGEVVDFSAQVHDVITMTINGNNVSGVFQENFQGVIGIGETTGLRYHGGAAAPQFFKASLVNGQVSEMFNLNEHFIIPGQGDNFTIQEFAHLTINANGTVTVDFFNFSAECK